MQPGGAGRDNIFWGGLLYIMELLSRFLATRPALRLHYEQEGSVKDYFRHLQEAVPRHPETRLAEAIARQAAHNLAVDPVVIKNQLLNFPLVSSADHVSLINHNILYNANLLYSAFLDRQMLPVQIVLATGKIPLDNASYPRGIFYQGQKLPFFGAKTKYELVNLFTDNLKPDIKTGLASVLTKDALRRIPKADLGFLEALFFDALKVHTIGSQLRYADQLSILNQRLWPLYFDQNLRTEIPAMVYLEADGLIRDILIEDLADSTSLVYRMLTNPTIRSVYLKEFDGVYGCWSGGGGTHFFWGVSDHKTLVPLRIDNRHNLLVPERLDTGVEPVHLYPEDLAYALDKRWIAPSLFLDIFVLAFQGGLTLMGGFNQVTYLAWMRVAHERCMLMQDDWPTATRFAQTVNDGLICGLLPFNWESGLDLIRHYYDQSAQCSGSPDFRGGLSREDMDKVLATSMKELLRISASRVLELIE